MGTCDALPPSSRRLEFLSDEREEVVVLVQGNWACFTWKGVLEIVIIITCARVRDRYAHTCRCCHTEIQAADQTCYFTQWKHTDTGPISPSFNLVTPNAWQGSFNSTTFYVTAGIWPKKERTAGETGGWGGGWEGEGGRGGGGRERWGEGVEGRGGERGWKGEMGSRVEGRGEERGWKGEVGRGVEGRGGERGWKGEEGRGGGRWKGEEGRGGGGRETC